jgi:hypothetical protein
MRTPITQILLVGIAACLVVLAFAVPDRGAESAAGGAFHRDAETGLLLTQPPPSGWTFSGPDESDPGRRFRISRDHDPDLGADAEALDVTVLAADGREAGLTRSELFARERTGVLKSFAETKSLVTDRHVRLGSLGDSDRLAARGTNEDGREVEVRSYVLERDGLLVVYRVRGDAATIAARRGELDAILSSLRFAPR